MRADDVLAGHRFFWEQVGVAIRMTRMVFDTDDHLDLPRASGYEFLTGRIEGRDLMLGYYLQRGNNDDLPYSVVLASVQGLPDDVEVSIDVLGDVITGFHLQERLSCPRAKDKTVTAPASTAQMGSLELVVSADLPSFIEHATREVLCSLEGGIRSIRGRHWVGVVRGGDPYPFNRTLKRAIARNEKALASIGIDVEDMAEHARSVVADAVAIDQQFSASDAPTPPLPPPRSRIKKRR